MLIEAIKEQQEIIAKQQGAMERQQRTIAELSDKVGDLIEAGAPERSGCRRHGGVRTRS
ncbi:MAG TPA: hypothetical protein VN260_10320 [Dissulfurispiraceae bacterium]|nr:hypothetical protein [Dissulfurispiraceae bacterium]